MSDLTMLTLTEAAKELGVWVKMLRDEAACGRLKTIRWGNELRIPRWALREWQISKVNESNPQTVLS